MAFVIPAQIGLPDGRQEDQVSRVFAAGDMAHGQSTGLWAMADGRAQQGAQTNS